MRSLILEHNRHRVEEELGGLGMAQFGDTRRGTARSPIPGDRIGFGLSSAGVEISHLEALPALLATLPGPLLPRPLSQPFALDS